MIDPGAARRSLLWRTPPETLDCAFFLPLFASGLRELEWPYAFVAREGTAALVAHAGSRLPSCMPALVAPLRIAINTREPRVIRAVVDTLRRAIVADAAVAAALVPFLGLLLPVLTIFANDFGAGESEDRRTRSLGDCIAELLALLRTKGGEGAFEAIKVGVGCGAGLGADISRASAPPLPLPLPRAPQYMFPTF